MLKLECHDANDKAIIKLKQGLNMLRRWKSKQPNKGSDHCLDKQAWLPVPVGPRVAAGAVGDEAAMPVGTAAAHVAGEGSGWTLYRLPRQATSRPPTSIQIYLKCKTKHTAM